MTAEQMRAAILVDTGRMEVTEVRRPAPAPGEVLIRTERAAICGSDLHKVFGPLSTQLRGHPGFPGHEGVGEVVESRSPHVSVGTHVLTVPDDDHAATFAEFQVLPDRFVVPLPSGIEPYRLLEAQQLGTVLFALKRFWPAATADGGTATVIGCGPAGLQFVRMLKQRGFGTVVTSDPHPHRQAAARRYGADVTVTAPDEDVVEATFDASGGAGADLVIEAAGHDVTRDQAMQAVRVGGRIGLFGLPEHEGPSEYHFAAVFRRRPTIEICVGAQYEPRLASFGEALDLLAAANAADELVTHTFALESLPTALETARTRTDGAIKVAVAFPG